MTSPGGDAPPATGGEFLLQLLQRPPNFALPTHSTHQPPSQNFTQDPAVAAVGPSISTFRVPHAPFPLNAQNLPYPTWNHFSPPTLPPHNYIHQNPSANPNLNPDFSSPPAGFNYASSQFDLQFKFLSLGDEARKSGSPGVNPKPSVTQQQGHNLIFGSLNRDILPNGVSSVLNQNQSLQRISEHLEDGLGLDRRLGKFPVNSVEVNENAQGNSSGLRGYKQERSSNSNDRINQRDNGNYKVIAPPPGFSSNTRNREYGYGRRSSDHSARVRKNDTSGNQFDSPGVPVGSSRTSSLASAVEESVIGLRGEDDEDLRPVGQENGTDIDDPEDRDVHSIVSEIESVRKSDKKHHRDKDYRSDKRGQWIMSQRIREVKSHIKCRSDIIAFNGQFLAVFESLIPSDEEKIKQKQLLSLLNKLVSKEWPEARLYLYGSCANSFGFQKSDIDVCLEMDLGNIDKSTVLLKLADVFESDNLQNVQALTRARVPVVKLMDPVTGISCDICINNVLAVINTKLLHDYAKIDVRLRQLAFIVKHWAKSRGVNETYHGTLSSYAYVIMCINFLQQRQPPILPCLQGMQVTYYATVENVECAYFDDVEKLKNFGSRNGESIAQLVWAFFHYWAYCHDYSNDVISVRTGSTLSKRSKDWTRRVGNDRHLICIEDPFETSHDLGRVVDKFSIRVLREEFLRAAELLQFCPNPGERLFEPYIPD